MSDELTDDAAQTKDAAPSTSNIGVSADIFKASTDNLHKSGDINSEQRDLLWWFFCHCKSEGYGFGYTEAGKLIGYDSTTIYRIFNGKYAAKFDNICDGISRFKRLHDERAGKIDLPFVETSCARSIFKFCEAAWITQRIVLIFGDSQIGKTTALEEFARRHNHGSATYMRMPASAGVQLFMKELAKACYVSTHSSFDGLRDRILARFDNKSLLIIDEVHQAFLSYNKGSQMKVIEVIREIHDRTKCGLVLCGTRLFKHEMYNGKLAGMLEQIRRRGNMMELQLPSKPPKSDIDKIAHKFGLDPAEGLAAELITTMIHKSGLGMYVTFLQMASMMAAKNKKRLVWDHFIQAHDIIIKSSMN